ncbi:MAG TPA: hypothetical protein VFT69_07000 [Pseudolabrys sp.]|jgi:hypothetical protein|nr:hypothetical protein [Pseudolabrys sp.]
MRRWPNHVAAATHDLAFEAHVVGAGAAFACAYANSAEFDAALIAARRAAGIYGPKRRRKRILISAAAIAAGLFAVVLLIV